MADYIVCCMQDGDIKAINNYVASLSNVDQYIYKDDENCLNLLHLAAGLDSDHREAVIEALIQLRANLNCPGRSEGVGDIRPIHLAAMWGYELTVKLLLYHGADASLRDSKGMSAIDYASIFDNYLCISLLLRYGSLNSTASAWSAIMDSSLGESNVDSSFDDALYTTAIDFGDGLGAERRPDRSVRISNLVDEFHTGEQAARGPVSGRRQAAATYQHRDSRHAGCGRNNDAGREGVAADEARSEGEEEARGDGHREAEGDADEDYDPLAGVAEHEIDLAMDGQQLRLELRRLGRTPGPITPTTKRLYAKLLAHLRRADQELVYSPRTKSRSQLHGYSVELAGVLTGSFSVQQSLQLEREFIRVSAAKDYHGPKQFFNYLLIDPRVSLNLPEAAAQSGADSPGAGSAPTPLGRRFRPELFARFLASVFYIGKGQKRRDLMHLYDALADRGSITQAKIARIRAIWDAGEGVVSLHLFHNITAKEALAREALMIETLGLANLCNLLRGSLALKLGWGEHKRKQLGALLLQRAYAQLLNEGERPLRRQDLKAPK